MSLVLASGRGSCFSHYHRTAIPETADGEQKESLGNGGGLKAEGKMTKEEGEEGGRRRVSDAGSSSVQLRGLIDVNSKGN